ncbi:MAG: class I SAM-dependent methyltransferase [Bacteroidales bacterium]|nr:class I SAM-dependent methyltransferase [Bacteroidales bacterium]
MNSLEQIKAHYELRNSEAQKKMDERYYIFSQFAAFYRELLFYKILKSEFTSFDQLKLLEIGAGSGYNLFFFKRIGFSYQNLFANELMDDRLKKLSSNFPQITIIAGDACEIDKSFSGTFDVILQSTVFSSITDYHMRKKLALKMKELLKPNGIILWYDFYFSNPQNKYTRAVSKKEIKSLFDECEYKFYKTTLASPIARRIKKAYPFFNIFSFLRTHYVAVIKKK